MIWPGCPGVGFVGSVTTTFGLFDFALIDRSTMNGSVPENPVVGPSRTGRRHKRVNVRFCGVLLSTTTLTRKKSVFGTPAQRELATGPAYSRECSGPGRISPGGVPADVRDVAAGGRLDPGVGDRRVGLDLHRDVVRGFRVGRIDEQLRARLACERHGCHGRRCRGRERKTITARERTTGARLETSSRGLSCLNLLPPYENEGFSGGRRRPVFN